MATDHPNRLRRPHRRFPINRRHQGLATEIVKAYAGPLETFPINRRHQGLATVISVNITMLSLTGFQSIGVTKDWRLAKAQGWWSRKDSKFPINRRHQGLATSRTSPHGIPAFSVSFQSIGVTKDWRPSGSGTSASLTAKGFQSIGVTKDWRPFSLNFGRSHDQFTFPINRRHQGLATQTVKR